MSDENSKLKPGNRKASATETVGLARNNTGRVKFDERGNAVWEWAVTTGSFATDISTSRLKKLENETLALADDAPIVSPSNHIVKPNPKGVVQGYSPYDSGLLAKTARPPAKKKDLRRLGEFIKLREQATRNKQDKD
ncbi:MAG: hypothetical protein QOI88_3591 [Gammaproteobacteria bacterium]|nr:hypothetical protein [Gammaproteobacteria bacterium]